MARSDNLIDDIPDATASDTTKADVSDEVAKRMLRTIEKEHISFGLVAEQDKITVYESFNVSFITDDEYERIQGNADYAVVSS